MESSSMRSSSPSSLNLSNLFFGSLYPPTSNLVSNKKNFINPSLKSLLVSSSNAFQKMDHLLSMDDAVRMDDNVVTKKSLVQSLVGSLYNIVSKIPNLMTSMNQSLSVTVVENEGIISPEDIVKNLTCNTEHVPTTNHTSIKIFESIIDKQRHDSIDAVNISSNFVTKSVSNQKFLDVVNVLPDDWMDPFHDSNDSWHSTNSTSHLSDLELAIEESFRDMKNNELYPKMDITEPTEQKNHCVEDQELEKLKICESEANSSPSKMLINKIDKETERKQDLFNQIGSTTESETISDMEIPKKTPCLRRASKKLSVVAVARGKSRNKLQLRKSGVSQLKHRKERIRQSIYSNMQDDINDWNDQQQKSIEMDTSTSSNTDDESQSEDFIIFSSEAPEFPVHYESMSLGDVLKNAKEPKKSTKPPENFRSSSPICNTRLNFLSESSVDSEDSFLISFASDAESQSTESDFDDESLSSDESEEDEMSFPKVRFNIQPKVHSMITWNFAYRAARKGPWEEMARDRVRFRGRILCVGRVLDPILSQEHRECIYHTRFAEHD